MTAPPPATRPPGGADLADGDSSGRARWWLRPWARMIPVLIIVTLTWLVASRLAGPAGTWAWAVGLAGIGLTLWVYAGSMRVVALREPVELTAPHPGRELLRGALLGAGLIGASLLLMQLLGGSTTRWNDGVDVAGTLAAALLSAAAAAVVEELMFRGVLLQGLETAWGSRSALAVSAVLFGAAHLFDDGATLFSALAVTVEAGVLLGAAFLWRRDLRFVIGVHLAWNTAESLVGIRVSGEASTGLWSTTTHGPDLLTGGRFGLEGSLVPVLVSLAVSAALLVAAHRRGNLRPRHSSRNAPSTNVR